MLTLKQLTRLKKSYTKLKSFWEKSQDENKELIINEFNISIQDIEQQIKFVKLLEYDRQLTEL